MVTQEETVRVHRGSERIRAATEVVLRGRDYPTNRGDPPRAAGVATPEAMDSATRDWHAAS